MKSCVIRRRFHTSEAVGTAVTVNLEPGFGIPKACLIHYTETSAATDSFDTSTAYRNVGIGMIGSTDSSRNATLVYRNVYATMRDNQGASDVQRQNSNSRFANATTTAGAIYWQGTSATFTTSGALIYNSTASGAACAVLSFSGDQQVSSGDFTIQFPVAAAATAIIRIA